MKRPYSPNQLRVLLDFAHREGAVHRISVNPLTYSDFRRWGIESLEVPNIIMANTRAFGVPVEVVRGVRDGLVLVLDSDGRILAHDAIGLDPHHGSISDCVLCFASSVLDS